MSLFGKKAAGGRSRTRARLVTRPDGEQRDGAWGTLGGALRQAFFHNPLLKLVSLVLAIALFFLVNTDRDAIIGVNVNVSYQLPDDRVLVSEPVHQVRLSIRGPWRRIKRFDEREIGGITLDLTNMRSGPYTFPEDSIDLPEDLTLLSINPPTIELEVEPRLQKTVPVKVNVVGEPARGYEVQRVSPKPSQVTIRGAKSWVSGTEVVLTRELRLDGRSESFIDVLLLEPPRTEPRGLIEIADRTPVEVEVALAPEMGTRVLTGVPVEIVAGEGVGAAVGERFTTEPATVDVVLHGPLLVIEDFDGQVAAQVTVHAEDAPARPRQAGVQLRDVPAGVGTEVKPGTVTLRGLPLRGVR
jgi:YbbR domain-containing protein